LGSWVGFYHNYFFNPKYPLFLIKIFNLITDKIMNEYKKDNLEIKIKIIVNLA
jgi:hypothetical protein